MFFCHHNIALRATWVRGFAAVATALALTACGGGESSGGAEITALEVGTLSINDTTAPVYLQPGEDVRLQASAALTYEVSTTINGQLTTNQLEQRTPSTGYEWRARIGSPVGAHVTIRVVDPVTGQVVAIVTIRVVAPFEDGVVCTTWQDARQQYFCEKAAYEAARDSANPIGQLTAFLARYPQSVWKNNAIFDRDRAAYRQAQLMNTAAAYLNFMQTYPNVGYSPFFGNARTEYNECISDRGCRRTQTLL